MTYSKYEVYLDLRTLSLSQIEDLAELIMASKKYFDKSPWGSKQLLVDYLKRLGGEHKALILRQNNELMSLSINHREIDRFLAVGVAEFERVIKGFDHHHLQVDCHWHIKT